MTQDQKIVNLEHRIELLSKKIELLELQLQIERANVALAKQQRQGYPYTTWTTNTLGGVADVWVSTSDLAALQARIAKHTGGSHGPGTPAVS